MFESFEKKQETVGIETVEKLTFSKLAEHVGEEIPIYGYFFNTSGKYGESVTVITSPETAINLPKRYVEIFHNLSEEETAAIVAGRVSMVDIESLETKSGDTTTFRMKVEN